MKGLKQPLLGVAATALIIGISLVFISLFDFSTMTGWVAYAMQCLIPMQIVVGVLWKTEQPAFAATQRQPARGLLQLLVTLAAGIVVGPIYFFTLGGGVQPPAPMLAQSIVASVVMMFWLAIVWGGWPFTVLFRNPVVAGIAAIATAYVLNALLFHALFNYEFMQGAPVYVASLDPHGLFNAWLILVFYVTALSLMFLMLHFDLWPLTLAPSVMRQPVLGVVWTSVLLSAAAAVLFVATQILRMDPVVFLVRAPIPFIFGTIVVLNMLQNSLFSGLAQPVKGFANAAAAAGIGLALAAFYRSLTGVLAGAAPSGPPSYDAEIWLASALLAVTFPFLIFGAEFFKFWPLRR